MKTTIYASMVALAFITSLARMFNIGDDKPISGTGSSIIAQGARLEKLSGDSGRAGYEQETVLWVCESARPGAP
jgi:hypothetical protein